MDKKESEEDGQVLNNVEDVVDEMPDVETVMDGVEMQIDSIISSTKSMNIDVNGFNLNEENWAAENLEEKYLLRFCEEATRAFFNQFGLISHQINSYNDFVENGIQQIFDSLGEVNVQPGYDPSKKGAGGWRHAKVTFGKVRLEEPKFWGRHVGGEEHLNLLPKHARLQNMTYSSKMMVEVKVQVYTQDLVRSDKFKTGKEQCVNIKSRVLIEDTREILMGSIPVMVKSNLCWLHKLGKSDCPFDVGGYFLIKGMEKVFIAQERRCSSRLWVSDKPSWKVQYQSQFKKKRVYVGLEEASKSCDFSGKKTITICFLYATMPIWIMFFALGASSDKEILQMINIDDSDARLVNILLSTIRNADEQPGDFLNTQAALQFVDKEVKSTKFPPTETIEECIDNYLFPNIDGHRNKACFLGYMVKSLLLAWSGKRKCDNLHDFRNKRLELAGDLLSRELSIQIKHAERRMVRAMQKDLYGDRDLQVIEHYLDASIITNGLGRAFSTGAWSHPYKRMETSTGIVANLRRLNAVQMISDLRKTRQQVQYPGKSGDARYPNPSYWGKLCFLSTQDGENCGLVKNLAATGLVSSNRMEPSLETLISCGMEKLENIPLHLLNGMSKVLLNGAWVGSCEDDRSFVTKLKSLRRNRRVHFEVEIKWDQHQREVREVRIFSDAGRIMRPLLIVDNLHRARKFSGGCPSFQSLLDEQIIELIGVEEEEDCQTAWGVKYLFNRDGQPFPNYTHCELDGSFLLGLSCGIIPFANHNFARRVLFQSEKHSQQAIGFSTMNPNIRVDTTSYQLFYPQMPLFRTMISECLGKSNFSISKPELFNGQNAIVAVNVHQGYNQEDSLVMNRASLERGMFRTELFRCYKSTVDNKELTKRLKPKDRVDFGKMESKIGRADSLDDDGFPYIAASLQSGDLVIGKVAESGADHSVKLKHTEKGMVQKVVLSANDDGKNFAVVTLRQVRSPCLGDKFSSMHGQKGVVGFLESQENFPFTLQGIVPDIVINPHAFPSRQTPGQLLEAALGKGIACGGSVKYATPFTTPSVDVITDQLHRAGYSRWGAERVSNGRTGEMMRCMIFMGPTFYQRLSHMAEDKVKFRNTGPVHPLTRQPVADRKRFGGVRFGEMERDCLLAHGAAANLHERLFTLSDSSQLHVCQSCTRVANVIQRPVPGGKKVRGPYCPFCQSSENIVKINVPYGAKLLYQELFSMGICLKFNTEVC
uniref:DNA-directed RNA polymerase subunit beta n=1 Tax=Anthurium amnicola TaxID=1678845 RepID=A0A1D1YSW2_9ARAE